MRLWLAICIVFIALTSKSQVNCPVTYFEASYLHAGKNGGTQIVSLPSGGTLILGSAFKGCSLLKIDGRGDTVWNKLYKTSTGAEGSYKAVLNKKNNLIALMNENLVSLDTNGNILSSVSIHIDNFYPKDMGLLANEDILVLFQGGILARYSKDLSKMIWSKKLGFYNAVFSDFVIDNDKIILSGGASASETSFDTNPFVCSFDAGSGDLLNVKSYTYKNTKSYIQKLYKCGDGYFALDYVWLDNRDSGQHVLLRFDSGFNLLAVKKVKGLKNITVDYSFAFLPEPDGTFYVAFGSSSNLTLARFDNNYNPRWIKDIPGYYDGPADIKQNNEGLFITGVSNFIDVVSGKDYSSFYVVKCGFDGTLICPPEHSFKAQVENFVYDKSDIKFNSTTDAAANIYGSSITTSGFSLIATKTCTGGGLCSSLELIGSNVVCDSLPLQFIARKNKSCKSLASWYVFPSTNTTTSIDDSTISVRFLQSGNYKVFTVINTPCGKLIDSITVHVNLANVLNIGADAYLCKDDPFIIHAGNQFKTYSWQDGSSDSNYVVTSPGKYYVAVTDYCGNQYTDTINIGVALSPVFSAGNDTSTCANDSLHLYATPGFANYIWSTQYDILNAYSDAVTVYPDKDIDYYVKAQTAYGCYVNDTVHVAVKNTTPLYIGRDTSFCDGDSIIIEPNAGFRSYRWSTGSTASRLIVKTAGTYSVAASALNGCISADTLGVLNVYTKPVIDLTDNPVLCAGQNKMLDAGAGYVSYRWNTGSTGPMIIVNTTGTFAVSVTDQNGCIGTDTTVITGIAPLPSGFLSDNVEKCSYDTLLLQSNHLYAGYLWSTGAKSPSIRIANPGTYWLQVTDSNYCTGKEYIAVADKECFNAIYFPTAFTPNGDRLNDVFHPKVFGKLISFKMSVYNRFGEMIFLTNDAYRGWDGRVNGHPQNPGTYIFKGTYPVTGRETRCYKRYSNAIALKNRCACGENHLITIQSSTSWH